MVLRDFFMTFHAWKIPFLNSMTFHDVWERCENYMSYFLLSFVSLIFLPKQWSVANVQRREGGTFSRTWRSRQGRIRPSSCSGTVRRWTTRLVRRCLSAPAGTLDRTLAVSWWMLQVRHIQTTRQSHRHTDIYVVHKNIDRLLLQKFLL